MNLFKNICLFLVSLSVVFGFGPAAFSAAFETEWKVGDALYGSGDLNIEFRLSAFPGNVTIDWGDGVETFTVPSLQTITHTYASSGTYTVKITGNITQWRTSATDYNDASRAGKLTKVLDWGDMNWQSNDSMFLAAKNLTAIPTTAPKLSPNLSSMFHGAAKFNQDMSHWNTSNVLTMSNMFHGASLFNQPIGSWDTSKVTSMQGMFINAAQFNQPLTNWNTEKVTNMDYMFLGARVFNQPLTHFNTS